MTWFVGNNSRFEYLYNSERDTSGRGTVVIIPAQDTLFTLTSPARLSVYTLHLNRAHGLRRKMNGKTLGVGDFGDHFFFASYAVHEFTFIASEIAARFTREQRTRLQEKVCLDVYNALCASYCFSPYVDESMAHKLTEVIEPLTTAQH